ncbi:MAG: hypothetical protein BGO63_15345 [Candidatus Accumulibacter sp. 66-26]|nr:MAG: hypothetical protein BGO63_15345 [Candidatus Accumulibacter sp. 66-26]
MTSMLLVSGAFAGQSAKLVCTSWSDDGCLDYELWVSITADEDVGKTGAFGIGVWLWNSNKFAYWSVKDGFKAYDGGLVQPVEGVVPSLPAKRDYLIFKGSPSALCSLSQGGFDLYAGRGIIPADKVTQMDYLLKHNAKLPVDHIRGAYIQMDVNNNPWKVAKIFSWQCPVVAG